MITSSSNPQIKHLVALMKKSKERRSQNCFVVEGIRMCLEAPAAWVHAIYFSEHFLERDENQERIFQKAGKEWVGSVSSQELVELMQELYPKAQIEELSDKLFSSVSDTKTPQGILAVVEMPEYQIEDLLNGAQTHLLILESIQDPGNLGTMLRTGEGAGITGIIMNRTTVDLFNPKTIRSTMGSIYRMPFFITEDLEETISGLKKRGVAFYAAHLKGTLSYDEPDYRSACGFLIGNEGNGLSDEIAGMADTYIRIPMHGKVESLNAAIAATLLIYECDRQRRK